MPTKLVGENYTTPDLVAKVTGRAKYSEDYRAEGMLWAKILGSPMPHARVTRIDVSAALAMPGVKAIITPEDLPSVAAGAELGENITASTISERGLTMEPLYEGEPILAVAAVDELTAAEAIEAIQIDFELLPFAVDPLETLKPGSTNARVGANSWKIAPREPGKGPAGPQLSETKWTEADFAAATGGQLPLGAHSDEFSYGDLEAGFKQADLVLEETFVLPNTSHQPLETRSAMAYWQNGKLYMHCSTQTCGTRVTSSVARWVGIKASDVVVVSEYCGGGFGSKGGSSVFVAIPALLSKKANAPVMMRVSREEEHQIGRARPSQHSRMKVGFRKDGRITAVDGFALVDNGPYDTGADGRSAGEHISLSAQPMAMRWRSLTVLTNTPPRGAQRGPGGMQGCASMAPIMGKAARKLGIDEVAIHRINSPEGQAEYGGVNAKGQRNHVTSAFLKEAIDKGAASFGWEDRKARSGQRVGTKVRGIGCGVSAYSAGSGGYDGLIIIKPDGRLTIQTGIGNLGTESTFDCNRVAPELLGIPWEKVDIVWGHTGKNLPNTCSQGGSTTSFAMPRASHAAGMDAIQKLKEVAAQKLGGSPEDYDIANERVSRKGGGRGMSFAEAATAAIELGGRYDGHEVPEKIAAVTKSAAAALAGQGLMGVARDNYPVNGTVKSFAVSFAEVEVDVETGHIQILECLTASDCGTVLHPRSLHAQVNGGVMLGIAHAISHRWAYDHQFGVTLAKRFYQNKPPTILDAPRISRVETVDIPDPETPVGSRGVGESVVACGFGAVINAIAAAVGDEVFRRAPVTPDMIVMALEHGRPMHEPLTSNV